jgi:hypothetical protein
MVRKYGLTALWHPANHPGVTIKDLQAEDIGFRTACDINQSQYTSGHGDAYLFYNPVLSEGA